ncbi:MAG: hypothetical protein JWR63_953 [Conexibacter sp.]|nr:hypothetical protein [Conexibacter sp.]
MIRRAPLWILSLTAATVPVASAHGASLKFEKPCYLTSDGAIAHGSGFLPNSLLDIGGDWLHGISTKADGRGNVRLEYVTPALDVGLAPTTVMRKTITLSDPRHESRSAETTIRVVNVSAAWGQLRRPRAVRQWRFTGFMDRGTVYGHFLFHDKLVVTRRFGRPSGPCGLLTARAPGIPAPKSKLHAGHWDFVFDTSRKFRTGRPQSLLLPATVPSGYSTGR